MKLGALKWDKVVHEHQGWRLFSCIWLHAGIIHLLANMLSLVLIGIRLEQQFGFGMSRVIFQNLFRLCIMFCSSQKIVLGMGLNFSSFRMEDGDVAFHNSEIEYMAKLIPSKSRLKLKFLC